MALTIVHAFTSPKSDGTDNTVVRPSDWNANHVISGTVDETMFAFTDITTANVSTSKHGLAPKSPGDATLYLDGTGAYSAPAGVSGATLSANNDFTGTNNFASFTQFGSIPSCDNALVTIYQTMNSETNTSMVDIVATSEGELEDMTGVVILTEAAGLVDSQVNALYIRNDAIGGTNNTTIGIRIDTPEVDSGTLGTVVGIWINDQNGIGNFYSQGRDSKNFFEGVLTQFPYGQQQAGTITQTSSDSNGDVLTGTGTNFTVCARVGDIVTDNGVHVGQIVQVPDDTHIVVFPPGSFSAVTGANVLIYPAAVRIVDQLTSQGVSFAFNQSAMVISGFNGSGTNPCNFVIGSPTNFIGGETEFSAILGGNNNAILSSQSVIVGGINNAITGNQSVVLAGNAMTVSGSEVVAMGLSSFSHTVSQNNCFVVMDGNVGFGEVAPQAPLHITHDSGANTVATAIRLNAVSGGAGCGSQILWTDNTDVLQMAAIAGEDDDNWGGRLVFYTSPQTGTSPGGTPTEQMRIASTGAITFNQAYTFPTTDGTSGQYLTTDGSGNVTWITSADSPITVTDTDLRLLVDLTDPNDGGGGPDLRVFRFGGRYQNSSVAANTTWFTVPSIPALSDNEDMEAAIGTSISFFAYYSLDNTTLETSASGMTKGRIEYIYNTTAVEVNADSSGYMTYIANANEGGGILQLAFLDVFNHPDTRANITIHYVGEAFTSPEYYC